MKVVAAFPFFNELDLLEVHLTTLNEVVDHFVITEARFSHAGKLKPLYVREKVLKMLLLERRLRNPKDLVGRRGAKFELTEKSPDLPEFLVANKGRCEHLFLRHDRE